MIRAALLAGLVAVGIAVPATPAAAWIFWTSEGGNNGAYIGRARSDGSHVKPHFIKRAYGAEAIATDGTYVYWTNSGGLGSIGRARLNGKERDDTFISRLGFSAEIIAVGPTGIYWTGDPIHGTPRIGRANLDGTGVDKHYIDFDGYGGFMYPTGLALDSTHLYWTNYFPKYVHTAPDTTYPDSISRANLDGSDVDYDFITGLTNPRGLAVSGAGIYWASDRLKAIQRANSDGSDIDPNFIIGVGRYAIIAADGEQLLWRAGTHIARAKLDGSGGDTGFIDTHGSISGIAATP